MLKSAPHKANAIRFLEYLASDQAQVYFADGNNEWPAVKSVNVKNPALETMGDVQGRRAADRELRQEHRRGAEDRGPRRLEIIKERGQTRGARRALDRYVLRGETLSDLSYVTSPVTGAVAATAARLNLLAAPDRSSIGASPTNTIASEGSAASDSRSSRANW